VRWVDVSRSYAPIAGAMMPVAIESTADVRIAGVSTFSMTYDYQMVDGYTVNAAPTNAQTANRVGAASAHVAR
jgi:hypothetical protein